MMLLRKIKYTAILICLLLSVSAFVENAIMPETISKYTGYSLFAGLPVNPDYTLTADSVIIPLKRAGRLFLIEAKIEGEIGNMVFDTGANGLVFNSTYFRNHVKQSAGRSAGITGDVGTVEQIVVSRIEIAELSYTNAKAELANLGHLESRKGVKIMGLFGFGMIKNLEIIIDSKNSVLKLYRVDKAGNRVSKKNSTFKPDYFQKIETTTNILYLQGKVGGKIMKFCFDTGAETNVVNSHSSKNILNTLTITRRSKLSGSGSAGTEVLFGKMNDFAIGTKQIANMETIITNLDALSEAYGTNIDGMLGYNFMIQGTLYINFVNKQFGMRFN